MKRLEQIPGTAALAEAARGVLAHRLNKLRGFADALVDREKDDVEAVHQTRVYCRRVQSAADVLASALPKKHYKRLRKRLRRIRRSAGRIRDMDVLAIELKVVSPHLSAVERAAADFLLERYPDKREREREKLGKKVAKLARKGFWDWVRRHYPVTESGNEEWTPGEPSLADFARERLPAELDTFLSVFSPAPSEDYEQLHAVRIAAKRLRYVLEVFAGCFPPRFRKEIYSPIKRIQESLGAVNDSHNFALSLDELAKSTNDPALQESLYALRDRYRRRLEQLAREFSELWTEDQRREYSDRFHAMLKSLSSLDDDAVGDDVSMSSVS